ncbi:hypothetical protein ADUPG1_011351, partial [Aduncisulcus paluster]
MTWIGEIEADSELPSSILQGLFNITFIILLQLLKQSYEKFYSKESFIFTETDLKTYIGWETTDTQPIDTQGVPIREEEDEYIDDSLMVFGKGVLNAWLDAIKGLGGGAEWLMQKLQKHFGGDSEKDIKDRVKAFMKFVVEGKRKEVEATEKEELALIRASQTNPNGKFWFNDRLQPDVLDSGNFQLAKMLPNAALEIFEGKEKIKGMSCQEAMARIMRTVGLVRRPKKDKAKKKTGPKKGKKEREQRQLRRQIFKTHVAIEERRFRQVAIIWTNTVQ